MTKQKRGNCPVLPEGRPHEKVGVEGKDDPRSGHYDSSGFSNRGRQQNRWLRSVTRDRPYDPQFLTDGKRFLYTINSQNPELSGVYAGSLDDPKVKSSDDTNRFLGA